MSKFRTLAIAGLLAVGLGAGGCAMIPLMGVALYDQDNGGRIGAAWESACEKAGGTWDGYNCEGDFFE